MKTDSIHIKYLVTNEHDQGWGTTVNSVGFQHIGAGEPYPPLSHPTRYLFDTDKGRVLNEYQLLYITKGQGKFVSSSCNKQSVSKGKMFLIFPGEWHTYYPDQSTGWDEYWMGFNSASMDRRISSDFFSKSLFKFRQNDIK